MSVGLFQHAIAMSGTSIAPFNEPTKNPANQAKEQARVVGVEPVNNKDLVTQLRKIDAFKLVDSIDELKVCPRVSRVFYKPFKWCRKVAVENLPVRTKTY